MHYKLQHKTILDKILKNILLMIGAVVVRPLQCVEVVVEGVMAPCLHPPPSSHQSVVERHQSTAAGKHSTSGETNNMGI